MILAPVDPHRIVARDVSGWNPGSFFNDLKVYLKTIGYMCISMYDSGDRMQMSVERKSYPQDADLRRPQWTECSDGMRKILRYRVDADEPRISPESLLSCA